MKKIREARHYVYHMCNTSATNYKDSNTKSLNLYREDLCN